jgi:beta-carotene hydroxylase
MQKPHKLIERAFYRPSLRESACFLAYAIAIYTLPVAAMVWLGQFGLSGWLVLAIQVPLTSLAGYGLFVLGTTGHEGFHFNLSANRALSCYIGCFFSSILPLFCATGYFVEHWQHHKHNNTRSDPDYVHFVRFRMPFSRLLAARLTLTTNYLAQTLRIAFGAYRPTTTLPLSTHRLKWLARFNLGAQIGWMAVYGLLGLRSPEVALALAPVLLVTLLIASFNSYQEHAFRLGSGDRFARSRTSRVLTLLHAGSNFHVEHHLYPGVPCWRLPAVHRRLVESGWYDDKRYLLDSGLLGTFKYCARNYRYGGN